MMVCRRTEIRETTEHNSAESLELGKIEEELTMPNPQPLLRPTTDHSVVCDIRTTFQICIMSKVILQRIHHGEKVGC
jgi:hypothetical protein